MSNTKKAKTKKRKMGHRFEAEMLGLISMQLNATPASQEDRVQEKLDISRSTVFSTEMIRLLIDRIKSL